MYQSIYDDLCSRSILADRNIQRTRGPAPVIPECNFLLLVIAPIAGKVIEAHHIHGETM